MYDNKTVINQVIVLFLIMIIGGIAKKKKIITNEVMNGLIELLLSIALPAMIFSSFNFNFSKEMLFNVGNILFFSFIIHTALIFISKALYFKYPHDTQSVLRFLTIFSNTAFMGFPILESIYGKVGVFYASIFNVPFRIFLWTVGVMLFTGAKDRKALKNVMLNPGVIAVLLGLVMFLFNMKLPHLIYKTFDMVGSISTPLSMMLVGCMLADTQVKDIFSNLSIYYGAIVRLVAIPLASMFVMKALGVPDIVVSVIVILLAMPAGATTAIFAGKHNANAVFASKCVFVTTILSIFTIPMIVMLM